MQAAIELTRTEHTRHIALLLEKRTGQGIVPAKEQGGDEGNGHHFRIGQVTLRIIAMAQGAEHVGMQAVDSYNLSVHEEDLLRRGFSATTLALLHGPPPRSQLRLLLLVIRRQL